MFTQQDPTPPTKLNAVIDGLVQKMSGVEYDSEEFAKMSDQLIKLYKAKELDSNIQLKEIDTLGKQNEIEANLAQKEADAATKIAELEYAHTVKAKELKMREDEIQHNLEVKHLEHSLRRDEFVSNREQKVVENNFKEKELETRKRVSADTLALVAANLVGIVMIIGHERINVVTSKALGFVSKAMR